MNEAEVEIHISFLCIEKYNEIFSVYSKSGIQCDVGGTEGSNHVMCLVVLMVHSHRRVLMSKNISLHSILNILSFDKAVDVLGCAAELCNRSSECIASQPSPNVTRHDSIQLINTNCVSDGHRGKVIVVRAYSFLISINLSVK